ncbi:MAG: hypothetical protein ACFFE6_11840 [Candidatus Thorarchaeota archaeon]
MTRYKHVLVLVILILPIFALVPTIGTGSNQILTNRAPVDTSLHAQFAEETVKVAVYAEDNTTLPSYASGGVSTAYHANLIQLLEANGYAATPLSTEDILDHKLMAAYFDVFILPNNLPKDEIVNHVIDYWLSGGGILSFDSGLGYLYYHGLIVPGEIGLYGLLGVDITEHWGFDYVNNVTVGARHSSAKNYQVDDTILILENTTIHDRFHFSSANPEDFVPLLIETGVSDTTVGFTLDNSARKGGRIVQLPGNCSYFPSWETSIIFDSIDWLTPRPKGRIAIDLSHHPYYGVDAWDENVNNGDRYYIMRDLLVNHSFTFDKLYLEPLTSSILNQFDVLMIDAPSVNYSATEMALLRSWVEDGGGLFYLSDFNSINTEGQASFNEIMAPWGVGISSGFTDIPFTYTMPDYGQHPVLEGVGAVQMSGGEWVNISGSAFPIVLDGPNIGIAGVEAGQGRVIISGDINWPDYSHIGIDDNAVFVINLMNWLSAATAKVLVYADYWTTAHPNWIPLNSPIAQALNDLDIDYYITSDIYYFNMSFFSQNWDMVVFDNEQWSTSSYQTHLMDFAAGGGKLVFSTWGLNSVVGDYFGVGLSSTIGSLPIILLSAPTHPIYNLPADYAADNLTTTLDVGFGTNALNLTVHANATALAGYSGYTGGAITINSGGNVIVNGPMLTLYNDDTDDSTYPDNIEIWENEIAFLYFDRPTINHPADVTYMETETGNEITWTPTADAGSWWYVFSVNGTPVEEGRWVGGALAFNVDGVNESITEYELDVFDRLGYSVSDLVMLNVTEYIAPPGPGGFDLMLLLLIGGAVAGIVVILVVVMQLKKKK